MSSAFNIPSFGRVEAEALMEEYGYCKHSDCRELVLAAYARGYKDALATPPVDAVPGEPVVLDELRATICGVGIVGQIDGDDVIRRESVIDLIDRRRLAASVASRAGSEPVAWEVLTLGEWRPTRFPDELRAKGYEVRIALPDRERAASLEGMVLVPRELLQAASKSLGSFVSEEGWLQQDMDVMDSIDAVLAGRASAGEAQS